MTGLTNGIALNTPTHYSVNDGVNWLPYKRLNPAFEVAAYKDGYPLFSIATAKAASGTQYAIYRDFYENPSQQTGGFETPGGIVNGRTRIDLPQLLQLTSLYLDAQQRLYITGSDAVCGRGNEFRLCNSQGGRGIINVSKRPTP